MTKSFDFKKLSLAKKSLCLVGISVFLLLLFGFLDFAIQGSVFLEKFSPIGFAILLPWFVWALSDQNTHMLDSPHLMPLCWIFSAYLLALSFLIYVSFLPVASKLFVVPLTLIPYLHLMFLWHRGATRA